MQIASQSFGLAGAPGPNLPAHAAAFTDARGNAAGVRKKAALKRKR